MAKKIYLSPSSQRANTYAAGDTDEQTQCRRIAQAAVAALNRCGFEAKTNLGDVSMYDRVRESNAWGADLHVPVHTNAFNRTMRGTRLFCSSTASEGGLACKAILEALAPVVPGDSDGIRAANYYEITATKMPCAYVEAAFHDHPEQAAWIIDHTDEIGEAICKGICRHYGVPYAAVEENAPEQPVYRVQVGAFHNKQYALALLAELQDKGYHGFVVS